MYIPDDFAENSLDVLHSLIAEHPFGVLFTHGSNGLDANHGRVKLEVRHKPPN
ncbi:FMN-binding negative transcriptional regulator [Acinetobacter pittii]|uniref:FMN-binding negative transcriptional regulator n=1 Tax=Acinetobacter pittii TaxID=48296 RepID=UPI00397C2138